MISLLGKQPYLQTLNIALSNLKEVQQLEQMLSNNLFPGLWILRFPYNQNIEKAYTSVGKGLHMQEKPKFIKTLFEGIPNLREIVIL